MSLDDDAVDLGATPAPGVELEPVKIETKREAHITMAIRAIVAGVAAFAGALATASLGSTEIYASQIWAAVAAGSIAVGVVIGVPDKALNTQAPRGDIERQRDKP